MKHIPLEQFQETNWYKFYSQIFSPQDLEILHSQTQKAYQKSIRINTWKISIEAFHKKAAKLDWKLTPIPWCPEGFWIQYPEGTSLGKSLMHQVGMFYIQDASSMLPVTLLDISEFNGQLMLDMCASPGSKTTQLLNYTGFKSIILANEPSGSRLSGMTTNLSRLGSSTVIATKRHGQWFGKKYPNTFDAILIDAPCSGDGMMRRDHKILKSWSPEESLYRAKTQKELLLSGFEALKPGGQLIYSTCTLSPFENENVVQFLLNQHPDNAEVLPTAISQHALTTFEGKVYDKEIQNCCRILPWKDDSESFFAAKISKRLKSPTKRVQYFKPRHETEVLAKKKLQIIQSFFKKQFGIEWELKKRHVLIERNKTIWMIPQRYVTELYDLNSPWPGLKICKLHHHTVRISHEAAISYGQEATKNRYHLDNDEYKDVTDAKDVIPKTPFEHTRDILLFHNNICIGTAKSLEGKLKNNIPREVLMKI